MEITAFLSLVAIITVLSVGAFFALKGLVSCFNQEEVTNKDRRFGSADNYIRINNLLFTENEIKVAKKRAEKNKEDLI